ncbi:MAG: hypothetical protein FIA97_13930 [Methylococcaceae bacterium]|nr:hypothetical protein [Methylococcaceae bacterium]
MAAKRDNPMRSIRQIRRLLESSGRGGPRRPVAFGHLPPAAAAWAEVAAPRPEEHRCFVAEHTNAIWYVDMMHGPAVTVKGRNRKAYLVSLMEGADERPTYAIGRCLAADCHQRLLHRRNRPGHRGRAQAGSVEARPAPKIGGGPRRRLPGVHPARHLRPIGQPFDLFRPYAPEVKSKLERWYRTFRGHLLNKLDAPRLLDLDDLNARLWAGIKQVYHRRHHGELDGQTPLERYRRDSS